jgi:hypothetical protein
MVKIFGELKGRTPFREIMKTPVLSVVYGFTLDLVHNDVPVTLYYKHKNNPWKTMLINNAFTPEAVPHSSEIYLSASLSRDEKVTYSIDH